MAGTLARRRGTLGILGSGWLRPASGASMTLPFSKAWLREEARRLSRGPYQGRADDMPDWLAGLDWDAYQSIRFRKEHSLWGPKGRPFQVQIFHLGLFFTHPVQIHEVVHGVAVPVAYSRDFFKYGASVDSLGIPSSPCVRFALFPA
ncbi:MULTISPECIES: glucan biosynthesis protein [Methylococcus]|uniref:Glucan biosynthesis protein n=1 Tax=Methylococcus capsulatus TaxID=414 RepID=A0ABZ2F4R1_METCP|nr:glucan biosynthesis protein [Methylococcus sp. BF19-07]